MKPRLALGARPSATAGFTLLEVMIAVAILAGSLTWLVSGVSGAIRAENHAKLMSTASFLMHGKMIELEDELYDKGFGEFEKEANGTFDDKGFARFTWRTIVDKVELPSSDQLQTVLTNAQQARQQLQGGDPTATPPPASGSGAGNPLGAGASSLASQFGIIKDVLEQGIRRVTVKVEWAEGRRGQSVELVAYYTDPRKVDQAIQLSIPAAPGAPGAPGSPTASPGSSSPSTSPSTGKTP